MKRKYTYKSGFLYFAMFGMPFAIVLLPVLLAQYSKELSYAAFGVLLLVTIFLGVLLEHMPAELQADENEVTFRQFLNTICIPYTSIRSMEVTREYVHAKIRGEIPQYVEKLHIVTDDDEYDFHAVMQIDMDEVAKCPEKLQTYFENGVFRQLQIYISSHE